MAKKFHQFIRIDKGPVKSAIIDLLSGHVFHVCNKKVDLFYAGNYLEIKDFVDQLVKEGLVIEVGNDQWIPDPFSFDKLDNDNGFILEIDASVNIGRIRDLFRDADIKCIVEYGNTSVGKYFSGVKVVKAIKNFNQCHSMIRVNGHFHRISREFYFFNMKHNSCWGKKISITDDNIVRPCIYSQIEVGSIYENSLNNILKKIKFFWQLTKDTIEKCSNCEFKYICFDCREIPLRRTGNIYSSNPLCSCIFR